VKNQYELIEKKDWDLLIILDACRYDYFERVYTDYLEGKLVKVISPASSTYEWCKKVLEQGDFSDVIYVSANPHINSVMKVGDFDPRDKFKDIIDVWKSGWDERIQTVRPEVMTTIVSEIIRRFPDTRIIAHYLQPHFPAISLQIPLPYLFQNFNKPQKKNTSKEILLLKKIRRMAGDFIERLPSALLREYWKFQLARGKVVGPGTVTFAKVGIKRMRKSYEENLRMALVSIVGLIERVRNKKVVITSDHGELLGDTGFLKKKLGHPPYLYYRQLIEVPWFEVRR